MLLRNMSTASNLLRIESSALIIQMDQEVQSVDSEARQHERYEEEKVKAKHFVVPDNKAKLRACEKCKLLKTEEQWRKSKRCENCKQFKDEEDYKTYTTPKFQSMVTIVDPARSWLRRKLFLGKNIVSGVYAVNML